MIRVGRRAITSQAMALLLLIALLPMQTYVGHWDALASLATASVSAASIVDPEHDHEHSQHCHEGSAGCAEQPLPPATGLVALLGGSPSVVHHAPAYAVSPSEVALRPFVESPPTPPPRLAA